MLSNLFKKKNKNKPHKSKKLGSHKYQLEVKEVVRETKDAITIVFEQPDPPLKYEPGQFLTLLVSMNGEIDRRPYSLCTSPYLDADPAVTVKRIDDGKVSNYLNDNLKAGDTLEVMEPAGRFTANIDKDKKRHLILFGGGSGITPLISIIRSVLYEEPDSRVSLIYANRHQDAIIFYDTLENLKNQYNYRFTVIHVLEKAPDDWNVYEGMLNQDMIREILDQLPDEGESATEFYLCGPQGMRETAMKGLQNMGVPKERIFQESFVAGETSPEDVVSDEKMEENAEDTGEEREIGINSGKGHDLKTREVTVIYEDEEYKFTVEPDSTILQTALALDIDLPHSCQSGMCTTCIGKAQSGKIMLDVDESLSENEKDEGYVLTCVGHPLTSDVVIKIED